MLLLKRRNVRLPYRQWNPQTGAEFLTEAHIPVAFLAADMVVDVAGGNRYSQRVRQSIQCMQKGNAVRAAG